MNRIQTLLMCVLPMAASLPAQVVSDNVTFNRLLNAGKEPQNWLTYSGNYMSQRYSPLDANHAAEREKSGADSGCSRHGRSKSLKPRRWWWMASCTPCRRPTTSWRSTR